MCVTAVEMNPRTLWLTIVHRNNHCPPLAPQPHLQTLMNSKLLVIFRNICFSRISCVRDPPAKAKGKATRREGSAGAATASMVATWRREDDVEPSAKMLAMIDALKEAETHGDKTIVYSQCTISAPAELQWS